MPAGCSSVDTFEAELEPVLDVAYRVALRMTKNSEDASDLVQETVVKALSKFDSFEPGSNFRAWLMKIMTNLYIRQRQRHRDTVDLENVDDAPELYLFSRTRRQPGASEDPAKEFIEKMDAEQIAAAVDSLPEDYRLTTALYLTDDYSYEEIADIVGVPVGTVRSRIHRGRNLLQRQLWHLVSPDLPAGGGSR